MQYIRPHAQKIVHTFALFAQITERVPQAVRAGLQWFRNRYDSQEDKATKKDNKGKGTTKPEQGKKGTPKKQGQEGDSGLGRKKTKDQYPCSSAG